MAEAILELKNITKAYDSQTVLKDVSLSVYPGEVVAILGPSGCGKSTLLRCTNGLEAIQSGSILFQGQGVDWSSAGALPLRQKIGMVFQNYELFPHMTVLENVLMGPVRVQKQDRAVSVQRARQLLNRVGLLDKEKAYPRQLSGGQKQRVAIVRAIIMEPKIMLFDEVTASLDPEMVREVLDVILGLAREGMTMLIVTHELGFARAVADRVVFMHGAGILESGSAADFFAAPQTEQAQRFLQTFAFA